MKEVKVIMLPTKKANIKGQICQFDYGLNIAGVEDIGYPAQHLYFVCDENIKKGEYGLDTFIKNCLPNPIKFDELEEELWAKDKHWKKVIATTDIDIGLPLIPDSFIQDYVKVEGKIDEVMVEWDDEIYIGTFCQKCNNKHLTKTKFCEYCNHDKFNHEYKKGVETRSDNTVIIHQTKTYTREEVKSLIFRCILEHKEFDSFAEHCKNVTKWIEENL